MAILKHFAVKNADYGAVIDYLKYQHTGQRPSGAIQLSYIGSAEVHICPETGKPL